MVISVDPASSSVCTISAGVVSFTGVGTCTLDANQAGNTNWNPAPQQTQTITVGQGSQTINFTSTAPTNATVGGPTYTPTATATSGLAVSFSIDPASSSVLHDLGGGRQLHRGRYLHPRRQPGGRHQLEPGTAEDPGDHRSPGLPDHYLHLDRPHQRRSRQPDLHPDGHRHLGPGGQLLDRPRLVLGVHDLGGGRQLHRGRYLHPRCQPGRKHQLEPCTPADSGDHRRPGLPDHHLHLDRTDWRHGEWTDIHPDGHRHLGATGQLSRSIPPLLGVQHHGGVVSFTGVGTCTLDANQAGNINWNPSPQQTQVITVAQGSQIISFTSTAPTNATVSGPTYTPTAIATSGLAVSFSIDPASSSFCSIAGGVISFTGAGTCTLDANQAGDTNWNPAPQQTQVITVGQDSQTTTFTSTAPTGATVNGPTYTPTATATSGLPVAITVDGTSASVCSIAGGVISFTGMGTCTLDANQPGNRNWSAAPHVSQSVSVGGAAIAGGNHLAALRDGTGYWVVGPNGSVTAFGAAVNDGSMAGQHLNAPIVGIAANSDGKGYWLVASDGGVFSFGDAGFYGLRAASR